LFLLNPSFTTIGIYIRWRAPITLGTQDGFFSRTKPVRKEIQTTKTAAHIVNYLTAKTAAHNLNYLQTIHQEDGIIFNKVSTREYVNHLQKIMIYAGTAVVERFGLIVNIHINF